MFRGLLLTCFFNLSIMLQAQQSFCTVTVSNAVVYGVGEVNETSGGGSINLLGDLYLPAELNVSNKPAIVLVHGGSFKSGSRSGSYMTDAAYYYTQRGFVCFSIDYRLEVNDPPAPDWIDLAIALGGEATLKAVHAAATDAKKALRWLRANAATYGIDADKVAAVGVSAGAFCALMANVTDSEDFANDEGTPIPDTHPSVSGKSDACIDIFGDIGIWSNDFDSADAPIMIVHGTADAVVPFSSALTIRDLCVTNNIPHSFYPVVGGGHDINTWHAVIDGVWIPEHGLNFLQESLNLVTTNGTPQMWLDRYGVTDEGDEDGDSHVSWQEYRAATLPHDSNSVFAATVSHDEYLRVSWPSHAGLRYKLWCSTSLSDHGAVITNIVATSSVSTVSLPINSSQQFYTVEVE